MFEKYREYKDSGVEWLGEIPNEWEVKRLGVVSKIVNGATPSSNISSYWEGDILWVTPAEINNVFYLNDSVRKITKAGFRSCGTSLVPAGSIVLTTRAPIGKVAIAGEELCTNQGCKSLVLSNMESEYVYYQLSIRKGEINSFGKGTTFMELGSSELRNLFVVCPPVSEQTAIANFLDRKTAQIDQAISIKEKQIELLKERRQILIHNAVTRGLDPDVKMKDSGVEWIGEIPEHWEVVPVRRVIEVRDGTHDTPEYVEEGKNTFPLITSKDFEGDVINFKNAKWISEKDHFEIAKRSGVQCGDVLMSMIGGNIGKSVIIDVNDKFSIKNVALFRTSTDQNLAQFLRYYFESGLLQKQIELKSRGGAQGFISLGDIRNLTFFKIPTNELMSIAKYLNENVSQKIATAIYLKRKEIEKLKEYKLTLMNSAVTGKIKVS